MNEMNDNMGVRFSTPTYNGIPSTQSQIVVMKGLQNAESGTNNQNN